MKLIDYLGLSDQWPPSICEPAESHIPIGRCPDIITGAILRGLDGSSKQQLAISTKYNQISYVRVLLIEDEVFARCCCQFFNSQKGLTIDAIAEMGLK